MTSEQPSTALPLNDIPVEQITPEQIEDLRIRIVNGRPFTEEELQQAIAACRHGRATASEKRSAKSTKKPPLDPAALFAGMATNKAADTGN